MRPRVQRLALSDTKKQGEVQGRVGGRRVRLDAAESHNLPLDEQETCFASIISPMRYYYLESKVRGRKCVVTPRE